MAYWRRIGAVGLAAAIWALGGGVVWTHAEPPRKPRLSIVSYQLVRVERVNRSVREYTFRARLKNRGPAISGARAVLSRKHSDFHVVDGELSFGPVKSGGWAQSLDTFSFRHRGRDGLFGHGDSLRWNITAITANHPPVAVVAPGSTVAVGQKARLDGTRSSDPDGDRLTFRWAFVSKPAGSRATLSNASTATPSFVVDVAGSYVVGLEVSDGQATSPKATTTISTPNRRPVADAGADRTVGLGERAVLSGAGSSDPDGDALKYRWLLQSRPAGSVAELGGFTGVESWLATDVPGRYVVQLVVNDGRAESAPDTVIVSTENSAPVARAGADRTAAVGEVLRLDGGGSSDVDGDSLRFAWSVVTRPAGSAATPAAPIDVAPSVRIDRAGTYRFRLVVSDALVSSAPDEIEINTRNTAPVAQAGPNSSAVVGEVVGLDGSGSTDADGDPLTYAWSLTSAPGGSLAAIDVPTAVAPRLAIDKPGTYVAQLIVSDAAAASVADTVVITTRNSAPTARAGADRSAVAGFRVPLDGSASSDPDGTPLSFVWALVAVPPGSHAVLENPLSPTPWFVADRDGRYVAQLIVSDGERESEPDTVAVSTTNARPEANAGADRLDVPVGGTVPLDGTASADADGHPLRHRWSLVAAPAGSAAALSDAASATPTFVADRAGEYVAQLVVSDGLLDSAPDTVLIKTLNREPVAVAGADQSVAPGSSVALDATGSTDPDDDTLTFAWEFVSRPSGSQASLTSPGLGLGAFVADVSGRFVVRVTVTDPAGAAAFDDVEIDATARGRLDLPADLSWTAVQTGGSLEQSLVVTNVGGATVTGLGATVTGSFAVDPQSACLSEPLSAGDSCEIQIAFRPTTTGLLNGTLTVTSSAPEGPQAVALIGEGRAPSLTASQTTLGFPPTIVGQSSAPTASVIRNDGIGEVEIQSIDVTGDFAVTAGAADRCVAGAVLVSGEACSVTATFSPTQVGPRGGAITIAARGVGDTVVFTRSLPLTGDGQAQPVVTVVASDAAASEWGSDPASFTLSRTGPVSAPLTVAYAMTGTATGGADYTSVPGRVTFDAGQAQVVVTLTPLADALNEGSESAIMTLTDGPDYDLGVPSSGSASIEDAFQSVTVIASDAVASEVGLDPGAFTFRRLGGTGRPLTVNFVVGGTASPGSDYQPIAATVVIPSGQAAAIVAVTPLSDGSTESAETVVVTLAAGTYVIGPESSATVNLLDNVLPRVTVVASDPAASEAGPDAGTFRFERTGDTSAPLTVRFTVGGSAAGTDFVGIGTSIVIPAGQASVERALVPINDPLAEGPEAVDVVLLDGPDYDLGAAVSASVTIADQPVPLVSVEVLDGTASEAGDTGSFRFSRTGDTTFGLSITIVRGGTATNMSDYGNISETVTFLAGQATFVRTLIPVNDTRIEGDEDVILTVADGASYDVGSPSSASIAIVDQPIPIITVTAIDPTATETGPTTGTFRFTRVGDVSLALTVSFTRGGTALSSDYAAAALGVSVAFPPDVATVDRLVTPTADALVEGSETVIVTLTDGALYNLGSPSSATVTITD